MNTLTKTKEDSTKFLRMLFDSIDSAIIVYDVINQGLTGDDYLIKDMNETSMLIEQHKLEEVKGKSIKSLRNNVEEFGIIEVFKKVWDTGEPAHFPAKAYKEGNIEVWFENRIFKLPTGEIVALYDDITQHIHKENKLNRKLMMESIIKDIAMLGLEKISLNEFKDRGIEILGTRLEASRVYVFENDSKINTTSMTNEWIKKSKHSSLYKFQNVNNKQHNWIINQMKNNQIISYNKISDIPDKYTQRILQRFEINAFTLLPIFISGEYYGFLGYDKCLFEFDHENVETDILMTISNIFSEVITRKIVERSLTERDFMMRSQFGYSEIGIIIKDKHENTFHVNKKATEIMRCTEEEYVKIDFYKATHPDDLEESVVYYDALKSGEIDNYQHQKRMITEDGSIIYVIHTGSCYKNEKGEVSLIFLTMQDITDQKKMERELFEEKEYLRITLQSIGDGVIAIDNNTNITMINTIAEEMTGYRYDEAIGKKLNEVLEIYDSVSRENIIKPLDRAIESEEIGELTGEVILKRRDATERIISDIITPIKNVDGDIAGYVLVFRDITEEKRRNEKMIHISQHDGLTGLYNRRFFEEALTLFDQQNRYPISLIMGDLNGLKITNDVFGHEVGDELLIKTASVLRKHARPQDILARWGGDEYVMLMPDTDLETVRKINRAIYKTCGKYENTTSSEVTPLSISLGYATHEDDSKNIMQLIKESEDFMYKGKLLESRSTHSNIISSIKKTLFEKSHETEAHSERLKTICNMMGKAIDLSEQQLNDLELFAMLHDIGKITIEDNILTKEGELTPEEWQVIERHPATGYRIVQSAPELSHIADYILAHHERWDGKGYPHRIKGEAIPVLARILSIIDSYDAMISDRPYRKAMKKEIAIEEIKNCAGKQYDPRLVHIFLEIADSI